MFKSSSIIKILVALILVVQCCQSFEFEQMNGFNNWNTLGNSNSQITTSVVLGRSQNAYFRFNTDDNDNQDTVNLQVVIDSDGEAEKANVYISYEGKADDDDIEVSGSSTPFNFTVCFNETFYMTIDMDNSLFSGDINFKITSQNNTNCQIKDDGTRNGSAQITINSVAILLVALVSMLFFQF
ncbi:hypothetical protein DLAC_10040 [Tieghemostelium lacteum]|uniref:Uncharacterized protein n=1 Tax=Tieghemostelium lacteum TaxID=361077 RepID=A0A151Z5Z7_TIELA|nr:hypothetical protein DLAC_10040 [Tieghemostelium lacteum]|eukprot:KYQ89379.1 hypothetical protein DLAC_10040 [Tieghemostelium lacteum]